MGRPSVRTERRAELLAAFVRVLGSRGRGGATIAALAEEAGIAPGLVHHHFRGKAELYATLADELVARFRRSAAGRLEAQTGDAGRDPLGAYVAAALDLGERSDIAAARAWVGLFAEAQGDPALFDKLRRVLDAEVAHVERLGGGELSSAGAASIVAFVIGALVMGAFAPRKTAGFAAPGLRALVSALRARPAPAYARRRGT